MQHQPAAMTGTEGEQWDLMCSVPIWFAIGGGVLLAADRAPFEALPTVRGGEFNAGESGTLSAEKGGEHLCFLFTGIKSQIVRGQCVL